MSANVPDFERHLLGHCLDENLHFLEACEIVCAEELSLPAHQTIFHAIGLVIAAGQTADILTVGQFLVQHRLVQTIGGLAYLTSLTEGLLLKRKSISDYAEQVHGAVQRRQLVTLTERVSREGMLPSSNVEDLLAETEDGLLYIRSSSRRANNSDAKTAIVPLVDRLHSEHERRTDLLVLPSGIDSLDAMTRGLQAGEVTIVGAPSGVGKSSLMLQTAIANCEKSTPVLIFSIEMNREQVLRRILAATANVPFFKVRDTRRSDEEDMAALRQASSTLLDWPLHIVEDSSITIEKLTAAARLAIRRDRIRLVCVDYAQIVGGTSRDERLRVAAVSRGLTRLAKDEGVPLMVLSQLSRPDRSSPNRRPTMSDLRESSQLENDAHSIVLLHREWDEEDGRLSTKAELIVAKQRSGETGILPMTFNKRSLFLEKRPEARSHLVAPRQTKLREVRL